MKECEKCQGSGKVTVQTVDDDNGVAHELPNKFIHRIRCPWCKGTGSQEGG
jgi:uncharacterized protein YlaI